MSLGNGTLDVLDGIDDALWFFSTRSFDALTDPVSSLMSGLFVFMALHALYSIALGLVSFSVGSLINLFVRYAIVWALAATWANGHIQLYHIIRDTPDEVINILVGKIGVKTDADGIDGVIAGFIDLGVKIADKLITDVSIETLAIALMGLFIFILMALVAAGVILTVGVAKLGAGLCVAVAPLFLIALLFQPTRAFFDGWLRLFAGFVFTYFFTLILMAFLLHLTSELILDADKQVKVENIASVLDYVLIVILSLFLLRQIPSYGAAIAGSAAIGIDGIGKFVDGMRGMHRGYNRAHGLRGDGRINTGPQNRRKQRARAASAVKDKLGLNGQDRIEHPSKARHDAERAARRAEAIARVREEGMNRFIRKNGGKTA